MPGGGVVRAPVGWLGDFVELADGLATEQISDALVSVGLEVERIERGADAVSGPVVVGRVLAFADEPQKNGKTIRWCQVDVGPHNDMDEPRGIVCGAHNFAVDDLVVVALPGAVLPGGFAISARKTYGHISDGMICSARELALGEDHHGILVLAADAAPGSDALDVLGLRDATLEISVTPDRGYCLSIRGLAREASIALDAAFHDVADTVTIPAADDGGYPVRVADPIGCPLFGLRAVTGLDPAAPTPDWLARRLRQAGMRPISLAVDVTNYVMLETGQPLHAFDRALVRGPIVVRRATAGERMTTLDGQDRNLDVGDLLITDDTGPIGLAGVMGGASTEISAATTDVLLEAAYWDPTTIARTVRRHRLPSEAAKRFERGVDPAIGPVALQRCVDLLVAHGGAQPATGYTVVGTAAAPEAIALPSGMPARIAGMPIAADAVRHRLSQVGCVVGGGEPLLVTPPSWRPDLRAPIDLVEEVVRLEGYHRLPSTLPTPQAGGGLTARQRLYRSVSRAVAAAGYTEVVSAAFAAPTVPERLGLPADDARRLAVRLANPLSDAEPDLRTSLVPGLLDVLARNIGRGQHDLALYEIGAVFLARPGSPAAPEPGVAGPPTAHDLAVMADALPAQPRLLGAVLAGDRSPSGWWGPGRGTDWADAVDLARTVAGVAHAEVTVRAAERAPWHPGRCAEISVARTVLGYAGELHPRVVAAFGVPARTCALELVLDDLALPEPAAAPPISTFPPVHLDVALVVDTAVPAAAVEEAVRAGAGELLESVRLFDVFADPDRLGAGRRSLAFALRFRAPDRTLTVEEATRARDAAVATAGQRTGAVLRG